MVNKLKLCYMDNYSLIYEIKTNNFYEYIPSYIPIVFHNLTGYHAHLFIKELSSYGSQVGVIAKNMEDYILFSIKVEVDKYIDKNGEERSKEIDLRFIDSIKFISSSLDSLVNNLVSSNYRFFRFEEYNEDQRELLIRKGIYPYEYMDSWERFEETNLPPASSFHSKLSMSRISNVTMHMLANFGAILELTTWESTTIYT